MRSVAWGFALVLTLVPTLVPTLAHAQTMTESGWTAAYTQAGLATITAVGIGADGVVYLGHANATANDVALESFSPSGERRSLALTGEVTGIHVSSSGTVFFCSDGATDVASNLMSLVPGQVQATVVSDFRPGNANDDDPAGVARVPSNWVGGALVSAGELVVVDSGDNDVVFAVSSAGVPRMLTADIASSTTLAAVAVSPSAIYMADREDGTLFALSGSGPTATPVVQTVTGGIITGSSVIVGLEYDFATSTLLVALAGTEDRIARLTPTGVNTWSATVIGTGFAFNDTATQAIDLSDDGALLAVATASALRVYARCGLVSAADCNDNGNADACDILVSGAPDCNQNFVPDECDLASATSSDCDADQIPDECAPCLAPLDVVFNVDTSATVLDEVDLLCDNLSAVVANLEAEGLNVTARVLGIAASSGALPSCVDALVAIELGSDVPGDPPNSVGGEDQNTLGSSCTTANEMRSDWGRSTSIVAGLYPFAAGSIPVVVNFVDGGPYCGSTAMNQADSDAVDWAINTAVDRGVIVSTVLGGDFQLGVNVPTETYAVNLANATGGSVSRESSGAEFVTGLSAVLRAACFANTDCNSNAVTDVCDVLESACVDCNHNGRPDECDEQVVCVPADDTTCDGVDDNCSGQADEDFVGEATLCGLGECASTGVEQCVDGVVGDTCTPGTPGSEVCNGLDDDCDGAPDMAGPVLVCSADAGDVQDSGLSTDAAIGIEDATTPIVDSSPGDDAALSTEDAAPGPTTPSPEGDSAVSNPDDPPPVTDGAVDPGDGDPRFPGDAAQGADSGVLHDLTDPAGCACEVVGKNAGNSGWVLLGALGFLVGLRRRRS